MDKELKSAVNSIKDIFPIESKQRILELEDIEIKDPVRSDLEHIKDLKLNDRIFGSSVYGQFVLKNKKNGHVLSKKKMKLFTLPTMTPNNSFLVDGTEYVPVIQNRLKKGAYTRIKENGEVETFNNIEGTAFGTEFNPINKKLTIRFRQGHYPIYPLLKAMDIRDSEIAKMIPSEVYDENVIHDREKLEKEIIKIHKNIVGGRADSIDTAASGIKKYFESKETDPETTKRTLGEKFKNINGDYMLRVAQKTINVVKGDEEADPRDSLEFKETYDITDAIREKLSDKGIGNKSKYRIRGNLDRFDDIVRIVNRGQIEKPILDVFKTSSFSNYAKQINPMPMVTETYKTTLLGDGGISSVRRITDDAQRLHDSTAGFLDPIHSPESNKAGVVLYMAQNTKKDGKKILQKMKNLKTGRTEWVSPVEANKYGYSLPGQDGDILYVKNDKLNLGKVDDVKYEIMDPLSMYDVATNSIPFLNYDAGARALLGSKFSEHIIPLKDPDVPFVQAVAGDGKPINDIFSGLHTIRANADGEVLSVTDKQVKIKTSDGIEKIPIVKNYPLNDNSILYHIPVLKSGDKFKKNDVLVDTNFSKGGQLAIGKNLNVAFMPYYGLNHEDGIVITENGARKLISEELKEIDVPISPDSIIDKNKFRAYYPGVVKSENDKKLDSDGIILPGTKIESGDVLVTKLQNKPGTVFDSFLKKLDRTLVKPYSDASVKWNSEDVGEVTDVVRLNNKIKIFARSEKPIRVGDKLVFRHGSKSIITDIIPDEESPVDKDGNPIDIIFSPLGIPSRINPGMLLEAAAGKLSKKTGNNYYVKNFDGTDHRTKIENALLANNIDEKEDLTIKKYNQVIPKVFVGNSYVTRLKQTAERQSSARSYGDFYDVNMQPGRGGGEGGQSVGGLLQNALLAHNATENLREMSRIKGQANVDYWRAIESGQVPIEPERPFVYTKFENQLKQMGINIKELNKKKRLTPLTDGDIDELSVGKIPDATRIARAKDLQPDKEGLFGKIPEGYTGETWSHLELVKNLPRPAMETVIQKALGISSKEFEDILAGHKKISL